MSSVISFDLIETSSELQSVKTLSSDIQTQFHSNQPSSKIMQNISERLMMFGNSGVIDFINYILRQPQRLEQIAKSSYVHQNGFFKIPLIQTDKFTLRLHIWKQDVASKETLHNHRWYLASAVLKGILRSEIWENSVCEKDPLYDEYLYRDKNSSPSLLGKVRVALVRQDAKPAGSAYVLSPDVLHRITTYPEDGMVATLVCRSASVQSWSRNIIVNGLVPDVRPHYLSAESLRSILDFYLKEVNE